MNEKIQKKNQNNKIQQCLKAYNNNSGEDKTGSFGTQLSDAIEAIEYYKAVDS